MEAPRTDSESQQPAQVDWEAFYKSYRKPGYLPGFEIVNKLGGGMFGLVFKARKESIAKDYAVKFLKVDDESVRDAVMREIDNVSYFAQIDHPNLVSIEDKGSVDGIPYLVMNYAGDATLEKRLKQGDMSREDALQIFVQAARGVQALHEHSLVHFDLKPANIFIKGDVARVGDYGLSKLVSVSRNSLSFGRGTPYYMAPEMMKRKGDARSDVYSLGIMLYECLYGEVPFQGSSEWEVLRKHETAEPEFPADALPADRDVILRCLAKEPEQRFQSASDLLRAMQAPVALGESMMFSSGTRPQGEKAVESPPSAVPPELPDSASQFPRVAPYLPPGLGGGVGPVSQPGHSNAQRATGVRSPISGRMKSRSQPLVEEGRLAPRSMPFRDDRRSSGALAFAVRLVFVMMQFLVTCIFVPVRVVSAFVNGGFSWLVQLPAKIFRFIVGLVGVTVAVSLVVLLVVAIVALANEV